MYRPSESYVPTQVLSLQLVFGQSEYVPFRINGGFLSAMLLTPTRAVNAWPNGIAADTSM